MQKTTATRRRSEVICPKTAWNSWSSGCTTIATMPTQQSKRRLIWAAKLGSQHCRFPTGSSMRDAASCPQWSNARARIPCSLPSPGRTGAARARVKHPTRRCPHCRTRRVSRPLWARIRIMKAWPASPTSTELTVTRLAQSRPGTWKRTRLFNPPSCAPESTITTLYHRSQWLITPWSSRKPSPSPQRFPQTPTTAISLPSPTRLLCLHRPMMCSLDLQLIPSFSVVFTCSWMSPFSSCRSWRNKERVPLWKHLSPKAKSSTTTTAKCPGPLHKPKHSTCPWRGRNSSIVEDRHSDIVTVQWYFSHVLLMRLCVHTFLCKVHTHLSCRLQFWIVW